MTPSPKSPSPPTWRPPGHVAGGVAHGPKTNTLKSLRTPAEGSAQPPPGGGRGAPGPSRAWRSPRSPGPARPRPQPRPPRGGPRRGLPPPARVRSLPAPSHPGHPLSDQGLAPRAPAAPHEYARLRVHHPPWICAARAAATTSPLLVASAVDLPNRGNVTSAGAAGQRVDRGPTVTHRRLATAPRCPPVTRHHGPPPRQGAPPTIRLAVRNAHLRGGSAGSEPPG